MPPSDTEVHWVSLGKMPFPFCTIRKYQHVDVQQRKALSSGGSFISCVEIIKKHYGDKNDPRLITGEDLENQAVT